jgi:hypothetical protein
LTKESDASSYRDHSAHLLRLLLLLACRDRSERQNCGYYEGLHGDDCFAHLTLNS